MTMERKDAMDKAIKVQVRQAVRIVEGDVSRQNLSEFKAQTAANLQANHLQYSCFGHKLQ